jgi:hypothetical protein
MMQDLKAKFVNVSREAMYRAKDIAGKAVDAGKNGIKWVIDNPDKAAAGAAAGAALFGGANKLMRSVNRNVTARRELHDKKHRVYDHSLGAFVYTKKPLSKKDIDSIYAERRRTGERVCEIMSRKGMLKK